MIVLMEITIYIALVLVGLCMGSFAGATTWRLRANELADDKKRGDEYDEAEYGQLKKLTHIKTSRDRSVCLHCSYRLRWYDLIPLVSWVLLRGKCRQCRHAIGYFEPLMELGVALFFVLSYAFWPGQLISALQITHFVIWLAAGVVLAILFAYDAKWFLLPDKINYSLIGLGLASSVIVAVTSNNLSAAIGNIAGSVAILSGMYYIIYLLSRGKWIGFGDIKLGLGLALLLADWQLAFIALFAANLIGCLIVIPMMAVGKLKRDSHIQFGPLLIIGTVIAWLAGAVLLSWYSGMVLV